MSAKCLLHVLLCKSCGTPSWPGGGGNMKKNVIMDRIAPLAQFCRYDARTTAHIQVIARV
jgi:hypothetical protein